MGRGRLLTWCRLPRWPGLVPSRAHLSCRRTRAPWYVFSSCGAEKSIAHPGWGAKEGNRKHAHPRTMRCTSGRCGDHRWPATRLGVWKVARFGEKRCAQCKQRRREHALLVNPALWSAPLHSASVGDALTPSLGHQNGVEGVSRTRRPRLDA